MSQDRAPSSPFVVPVTVLVAVPAVVLVPVSNLNAPASAFMSFVQLAQVLATVSVPPAATPIIPPPVATVVDPVVRGAVESISVDPLPPAEENAPSLTLYTAI